MALQRFVNQQPQKPWSDVNILGVTTQAVFALYPVVITTAKGIRACSHFLEQITSVKVAIRPPQRDIRTIARVGQNY